MITLSPVQENVYERAQRFSEELLAPQAPQRDREGGFPTDNLKALGRAGLLGVNVGGVPGVDDPAAFWVFSGFLAVIIALQIWLFKRWKWF